MRARTLALIVAVVLALGSGFALLLGPGGSAQHHPSHVSTTRVK